MKLSTKLILSFSVVVLLVGGIGIISSYINETVKDQVTTESRQAIEEVALAGEMGLQLYRSLTRTQYLLEGQYRQNLSANFNEVAVSNKVVNENIDNSLENFRQSIQDVRELIKTEHPTLFGDTADTTNVLLLLDNLEKKFSIYTSLIEQLQKLSSKSYSDGKEFFTVTIEPYFRTNLLPLIEEVRDEIQISHEQKIAGLNSQLDRVGYILGIATIFALVIAISLTFFLYRSIANPIKKLVDAAQNIAQGNLDDRIDYNSNDELGQLSQTFNNMAESLSRTTVSRDYVDSIIESMADLLIVTDEDYNISRINSAGLQMLDRPKEEVLGQPTENFFKGGNKIGLFDNTEQSERVTTKGTELWVNNQDELPVNVSKGSLQNRQGAVEGYVIVASNISAEKEAQQKIKKSLKEKEVLLAEVHHRVKNNLAVISGLLQMQIWEAENELAASALQQSQLRVQSIALVHEKLYQTESLSYIEFDKYVCDLLESISSTYLNKEESTINIVTDLESIVLNINQAIPCSLLLNEIVVDLFNSGQEEKTIKVVMTKDENKITMGVKGEKERDYSREDTEDGALRKSLIETLCQQLSGDLQFRDADGTEVLITFEVEEVGGELL